MVVEVNFALTLFGCWDNQAKYSAIWLSAIRKFQIIYIYIYTFSFELCILCWKSTNVYSGTFFILDRKVWILTVGEVAIVIYGSVVYEDWIELSSIFGL